MAERVAVAGMRVKLLVSPLARSAYFADTTTVARAELAAYFAERAVGEGSIAGMDFLEMDAEETDLPILARMSFVQGIFAVREGGLFGVDVSDGCALPDDLVFAAKYPGKTNEIVTRLALNMALHFAKRGEGKKRLTLLDPMAGRGTTLLWALRYGMDSRGVEKDPNALAGLHLHLKKQAKLHRISHKTQQGFIGPRSRDNQGKFSRYTFDRTHLQLTVGDSRDLERIVSAQCFDVLVTDLPYGVHHGSGERGVRIDELVAECAPAWAARVSPGGVLALLFNGYRTKRDFLIETFESQGCRAIDFAAPHRMSESIVRDLVLFERLGLEDHR